MKITKRDFYNLGGITNGKLFRKMVGGKWQYYKNN